MTMLATLITQIDAILPQTQCGKCNYAGCKPYAEAIAAGEADINQCPPGGAEGIHKLAQLLGKPFKPLSSVHGVEKPRTVALIDENICIGCALCIQACPVDAIVGAAKQMHTVVAELCTGCDLCIPPCPVDCITMHPLAEPAEAWTPEKKRAVADLSRNRFEFRNARIEQEQREKINRLAAIKIQKNDHASKNLLNL